MTEKWIRLGYNDIAQIFAEDEIEKLEHSSLSSDISAICQQQLDACANAFRYSFTSHGFTIDVRDHYIPQGYRTYVLNYARPYIAARFPNSKDIFIDDIRQKLFDEAATLLKEAYIGVPTPDYSDDPELSGQTFINEDDAMTIPYQRILAYPGKYGFTDAYKHFYIGNNDLSAYNK